jgi:hypothetical protein
MENDGVEFARWSATVIAALETMKEEQLKQSQKLDALDEKVEDIGRDAIEKSVRMEKIAELDRRVVVLEKNFWKASGVIMFLATVIPMLISLVNGS